MGAVFTEVPLPGLEHLTVDPVDIRLHDVPITEAARRSFWRRVTTTASGCWMWSGAVGDDGYGRITWTHHGKSRTLSTHRFALHLAHGPTLPPHLVSAHGCDRTLCVRVGYGHLQLATQPDNLAHAVAVGRHAGTAVVVDSARRRDEALRIRADLTGRREPPPYPAPGPLPLF